MHLLIWSFKLKLPYFFSGFGFQHLHSKLPLARFWFCLLYNAGLQQSMFCPQVMTQPAANMNAVPASVILTVNSKMAVKAPGVNQIQISTSFSVKLKKNPQQYNQHTHSLLGQEGLQYQPPKHPCLVFSNLMVSPSFLPLLLETVVRAAHT